MDRAEREPLNGLMETSMRRHHLKVGVNETKTAFHSCSILATIQFSGALLLSRTYGIG
jgi:hypothetical protein